MGTLECALESWLRLEPRIRYDGPKPDDVDLIVLDAPIWLTGLAGPTCRFAAQFRGAGRGAVAARVAAITLTGRKSGQIAVAEIGDLLSHAPLLSATWASREVENRRYASRLLALGDALFA